MSRHLITGFAFALVLIGGCRTPDEGGSETASYRPSDPPPDLPGGGGTEGNAQCGRDGGMPECASGQICVQNKHGTGPGSCRVDPAAAFRPTNFSLVTKLAVKPTNGGINPQYQGINISAQVMTGSNSCHAKGVKGEMKVVTKQVGESRVHHVWGVTKKTGAGNQICPAVFKPVYAKVTHKMPGLLANRDRVIVHSINDQEEKVSKLVYGSACPIPACAQPPTGCSLGLASPNILNESGCPLSPCGIMDCGGSANACPDGSRSVDIGRDPENGCPRDAVCVDDSTCPQLSPPPPNWCAGGTVISRGVDERGCTRAPACVDSDTACPQLSPPPPGWCSDGEIVSGGVNDDGCTMPPKCVRPGDCG